MSHFREGRLKGAAQRSRSCQEFHDAFASSHQLPTTGVFSPLLIVPPSVLPTFPVLREPVRSCFVFAKLSLCETEGLKNPGEVLYLLSELSYLLIAVAQ